MERAEHVSHDPWPTLIVRQEYLGCGGMIRRGDEKEDRNSELKTEREDMEMEKQALKEEIYKEIE